MIEMSTVNFDVSLIHVPEMFKEHMSFRLEPHKRLIGDYINNIYIYMSSIQPNYLIIMSSCYTAKVILVKEQPLPKQVYYDVPHFS